MAIPVLAEQSSVRSAQVVSVIGAVVIAAFGATFLFMHLTTPAKPLPGADLMLNLFWTVGGLLLYWRWRVGGKRLIAESAEFWKQNGGCEETRKHILGEWASRRPRYVRPLVGCTVLGLLAAALTGSLSGLITVTLVSLAGCVAAFPTGRRAARVLEAVEARAA